MSLIYQRVASGVFKRLLLIHLRFLLGGLLLLLLLILSENVYGLIDFVLKLYVVLEVAFDLFDGQIDEHTSDLGSSFLSDKFGDVLVDEITHHLLVYGIAWENSREKVESILVVLVDDGIRVCKRLIV